MHIKTFAICTRLLLFGILIGVCALTQCSCMSRTQSKHEMIRSKKDVREDINSVAGFRPYSLF